MNIDFFCWRDGFQKKTFFFRMDGFQKNVFFFFRMDGFSKENFFGGSLHELYSSKIPLAKS